MRWTIALAVSLAATPLHAEDVAIDSAVYLERTDAEGTQRIEPATSLLRGDRVVTILYWDAPRGSYTATSAVPSKLAIESLSHPGLDVSVDGGRTWRRLGTNAAAPSGTTHLRWRLVGGQGRMSYRAIVR